MKTLPRNICAHPDGYLVRIERGDLKWQAFVPYSWVAATPSSQNGRRGVAPNPALARALELRDKFYAVCPKARRRGVATTAHSNTDVVGISETIHWKGVKPDRCFIVSAPDALRVRKNKRFYYGAQRTRAAAFNLALAHRAQALGKTPADLLPKFCL